MVHGRRRWKKDVDMCCRHETPGRLCRTVVLSGGRLGRWIAVIYISQRSLLLNLQAKFHQKAIPQSHVPPCSGQIRVTKASKTTSDALLLPEEQSNALTLPNVL